MKRDCYRLWSTASTARGTLRRVGSLVLGRMAIILCSAGMLLAADESTGDQRYSPAKRSRLEAARRPRRVIFVDDNYGLSHQGCNTPEGFLRPRLKPLVGTHVDAITYCVYAHSPAHVSRIRPRIYMGHGGPFDTDREWTRNHQALLKAGQCPLKLVIEFAHANGMEAFAHMSMNDCHDSIMPRVMHPFKKQHPQLVVDTEKTLPNLQLYKTAYNFSHAEVRDRQYVIIEEVCQGYDVDGFEMDFIRHPMFFSRCMRGESARDADHDILHDPDSKMCGSGCHASRTTTAAVGSRPGQFSTGRAPRHGPQDLDLRGPGGHLDCRWRLCTKFIIGCRVYPGGPRV